jgi:hypothetical protein
VFQFYIEGKIIIYQILSLTGRTRVTDTLSDPLLARTYYLTRYHSQTRPLPLLWLHTTRRRGSG